MGLKQALYLHIGYHKTGTTSLQSLLDENRTALLDMGVFYPDTKGDGKRNYFRKHLEFYIALKTALAERGDLSTPIRAMANAILATGAPVAVISEESISGFPEPVLDALAGFRTDFDVKVIAVLRRQDSFLQSFYQQSIRDFGETLDFPEFLKGSDWKRIHYDTAMQRWADRFGQENMHVFSYDLLGNGTALIPSVMDILLGGRRTDFMDPSRNRNRSLPTICYETLKLLNRSAAPEIERRAVYKAMHDYVNSAAFSATRLSDKSLAKTYLTPEISQVIANVFDVSNARTAEMFFGGTHPFPEMMKPSRTGPDLAELTSERPGFAPRDMIGLLSHILINGNRGQQK